MLLPRPSSTQGSERRGRALSAASYLTDAMEGELKLRPADWPAGVQGQVCKEKGVKEEATVLYVFSDS